MRRLLETKITREHQKIGDWISSEKQATLAGLKDFEARQEARRIAAQGKLAPVTQLPRKIKP